MERLKIKSVFIGGNVVNKKVKITFVIPTFHRQEYLIDAIDSIICQKSYGITYAIIVVSNDPKYDADELIKKYREVPIAFYKNEENMGISRNWNRCFELCRSEYVAMLHDDDYLLSNYFYVIKKALKTDYQKKYSLYIPMRYIWNQDRAIPLPGMNHYILLSLIWFRWFWKKTLQEIYPEQYYLTMTNLYQAPSCGTLFRRKDFIEFGGFWTDYPYKDFDFATLWNYNKSHRVAMVGKRIGVSRSNEGGESERADVKASMYENAIYLLNQEKMSGKNEFVNKYYNEIKKYYYRCNSLKVRDLVLKDGTDISYQDNRIKYLMFRLRTRVYLYIHNLDVVDIITRKP